MHAFFRKKGAEAGAEPPATRSPRRFVTWNANSLRLRARQDGEALRAFVRRLDPDAVLVQETKMIKGDPDDPDVRALFRTAPLDGYRRFWSFNQQKRESGTLVLVKRDVRVVAVDKSLAGDGCEAGDGRFICVEFEDLLLVNTYVPNMGLPAAFQRRLDWDSALEARLAQLQAQHPDKPLVWSGDLNACLRETDVTEPEWFARQFPDPGTPDGRFSGQPGYKPHERQALAGMMERLGLVDAFQVVRGDDRKYSWGGNKGGRYGNRGMRIDYFLVALPLQPRVEDCDIHEGDHMGSDHRPVSLVLARAAGAVAGASAEAPQASHERVSHERTPQGEAPEGGEGAEGPAAKKSRH